MAESKNYLYTFTVAEIQEMEHEISESLSEIMELEDQKRKYDAAKNADIKEIRDPMYEKLVAKNFGSEERHAMCHRIINHGKGRVEFYSTDDLEHENLLLSEPLTDRDMQMDITDQPPKEPADELLECSNKECEELFDLKDVDSDEVHWVCPTCETINDLPVPEPQSEPAEIAPVDVPTPKPVEDTTEEVKPVIGPGYHCKDCDSDFLPDEIEFNSDDEWSCPGCGKPQSVDDDDPQAEVDKLSDELAENHSKLTQEPVAEETVEEVVVDASEPETEQEEPKRKPEPNIRDISDLNDLPLTGMEETDRLEIARLQKAGDLEGVQKILQRTRKGRSEIAKPKEELTKTKFDLDGKAIEVKPHTVTHSEEMPASDAANTQAIKDIGGGEGVEINDDEFESDLLT